jgi:hypothetical protein
MSNITRRRGDTYADEFILKSKVTGVPIDLTGYTSFTLTVDSRQDPGDVSTQQYQLAGVVVGSPTAGRIAFAPNDGQANRVGSFFFDVQVVDAAGRKRTVDTGRYIYKQDITKS